MPHRAKDVSPHNKFLVRAGRDYPYEIHKELVRTQRYTLFVPGSEFVCSCCFYTTRDISQHINANSGCALYLAAKHIIYCYTENAMAEAADISIISTMLRDPGCDISYADILAQPLTWNPIEHVFSMRQVMRHTPSGDLFGKKFDAMYQYYKTTNDSVISGVPLLESDAISECTLIRQFPKATKDVHKKYVDEEVQRVISRMIAAGDIVKRNTLAQKVEAELEQRLKVACDNHVSKLVEEGKLKYVGGQEDFLN